MGYGVRIRSTKSESIWHTTSRGKWLTSGCKHNQAKTKYQTNGYLIAQRTRRNHVFEGKGLTFVVTRIIEKQKKRRDRGKKKRERE
jgi:hypothetical protein